MTKLMRYCAAVSAALLSCPSGWACADGDGYDYRSHDLFICTRTLEPEAIVETNLQESLRFWHAYVGASVSDDDLERSLRYMYDAYEEEGESGNALIAALRERGDQQALAFITCNQRLYKMLNVNSWDYEKPSGSALEALLAEVGRLEGNALLSQRIQFLRLRCLYALGRYADVTRLWTNECSHWPESALKQRVKGYVAGVHYREGRYDEAMRIYTELGDDRSMQLCVDHLLAGADIERLYEGDPDAPYLPFFLQDYANYSYHASQYDYWDHDDWENYRIWATVTRDRERMVGLARRVVAEGRSRDLQMWQTFAGFLQMCGDAPDLAYTSFTRAARMKGQSAVGPLLRHYLFWASLSMEHKPSGYDHYMLGELQYGLNADSHEMGDDERTLIVRLYDEEVPSGVDRYLQSKGNPLLSLAARSSLKAYETSWRLDDERFPTDSVALLRQYMLGGGSTELEKGLIALSPLTADFFNERLGTRLIRDGQFAEAATYLEQVPLSYISSLGYAPYLEARWDKTKPFRRVMFDDPDYQPDFAASRNYKLELCRRVLDLSRRIETVQGDARAELCCQLGDLLYQATPAGDLWGLSAYGLSCYDHYNGLNRVAADCVRRGVAASTTPSMRTKCYYALASIPCESMAGMSYDYQTEQVSWLASDWQYEAYRWLSTRADRTEPMFSTCDWLKLHWQQDSVD